MHELGVVFGWRAEQRADHGRRDGARDVGDQVEALPVGDTVQNTADDLLDPTLMRAHRLRRELLDDQCLQPVVPGRVHRDHLQPLHIQRDADVVHVENAAPFRGEGSVVPAHRAHVFEPGDGPEAPLVRQVALRAEVRRRLALHPGEEVVGRPVVPDGGVGQVDGVEVPLVEGCHRLLLLLALNYFVFRPTAQNLPSRGVPVIFSSRRDALTVNGLTTMIDAGWKGIAVTLP